MNLLFKNRTKLNVKLLHRFSFFISLFTVVLLIFDFGFDNDQFTKNTLNYFYHFTIVLGISSIIVRYFKKNKKLKTVIVIDVLLLIFLIFVLYQSLFLHQLIWEVSLLLIFIRELFNRKITFSQTVFNPAQLFLLSFLIIILFGAGLLKLPHSTHNGINLIDAIFTATSAVCVTGLAVVDTGKDFTETGQTIILILIQIGGLGIMTFASYFSYFFRGISTFQDQLIMGEMTNANKLSEVFSTLKKILSITFLIEGVGAILIYFSLNTNLIPSFRDRIYFSIFHSISSFCNAGFSTLSNSFYDINYRFNYPLLIIIALLFIFGGMGFPIMINLIRLIKHTIHKKIFRFYFREKELSVPWILNLNSRIILITTFILIVSSTFLFWVFEYKNTLAEHHGIGKFITAFFGATTTRTAGFNSIDNAQLTYPTLMIYLLLMWIGASPGSTGGGIKTSTFAVATLNFLSLAKGKDRIEVYRREVANVTVKRAFAIISLSLIAIGFGVFWIMFFEKNMSFENVTFECFSAYSTVGLSRGITADLSNNSKLILIILMFVGRVSFLTLLIAIMKKHKYKNYQYPTEEILIN